MAKGKNTWVKPLSDAVNMGTTIAVAIALPVWLGHKLDERFGTGVLLMLLGLFFGMATAGKVVWERLVKNDRGKTPVYRKKEGAETSPDGDDSPAAPIVVKPKPPKPSRRVIEEDDDDDDDDHSSWW